MKTYLLLALAWLAACGAIAQPVVTDPGPYPDRIIATVSADAATGFSVTFRTDTTVRQAVLQLARATAGPVSASAAANFRCSSTVLQGPGPVAAFHSVMLYNLQPNTVYTYRVLADSQSSEWFQLRTAPAADSAVQFLYLGDAQNQIRSQWSRAIRRAYAHAPDAAFILHAGDLVNHAERDTEWSEWFHGGGFIHASVPAVLAVGNHEYLRTDNGKFLTPYWQAQFALPPHADPELTETCYRTDAGTVTLLVLNSNAQLAKQADWLRRQLASPRRRWTVVAFHHPVHSASAGRVNQGIRTHWMPLLQAGQVDLVLQGHDHVYARGTVDGQARPVYVVSVAGPKMYRLADTTWATRTASDVQLYQVVHADRQRLLLETYTITGELFDTVALVDAP